MLVIKLVKSILIFNVAVIYIHGHPLDTDVNGDVAGSGETHISYDQRQSGKYNIHIVIKDVAIIEMDQNGIEDVDYSNEDYYYDENDLTVRPITLSPIVPTIKYSTTDIGIQTLSDKASTTYRTTQQVSSEKIPHAYITSLPNQMDNTSDATTIPATVFVNDTTKTFPEMKERLANISLEAKSRDVSVAVENKTKHLPNSKMYKVKVHRAHRLNNLSPLKKGPSHRCRSNQYRDISGICRTKRSTSGSLLKRLFEMLVTLPFVRGV